MELMNSFLNLVVPPASLVILAFSWPALSFINACEWIYNSFNIENMEDKVVIITGASSGIGEQIAYEYAKRKANLMLVARRENRLRIISENARAMGAKRVLIMAADVVKEDDCRRFVSETVNIFGRVQDINFWGNVYPTLVALPYLHQSNGRVIVNASVETWLPLPRMSLYSASKAALVNFYETLRFEVKDDVGITIATHGWIGSQMTRGKFMVEDGAEMQRKEEREVHVTGGPVEEFAKLIVSGACRGNIYVKYPSWYDIFLLYRMFAPNILNWTFRLLLSGNGSRRTSLVGTGMPVYEASGSGSGSGSGRLVLEGASPRRLLLAPNSPQSLQAQKLE
ncbi:11-beta-hydroxysteroid dehydrogenase-like 5, partial [Cucurbita argyrosperma subsp. sororia]